MHAAGRRCPDITTGATSRLALRRRVEVAELLEQQWVLPGESILRSVLEEALQAKGFALPKIGVKSYSVLQRISLSQLAALSLPTSRSVLRYNGAASSVILLPVDLPIRSWPVAIVTLKGRTINPVVQTFVDCVRDVSKPLAIQNWVAAATKGEVVVHPLGQSQSARSGSKASSRRDSARVTDRAARPTGSSSGTRRHRR